MYGDIIPDHNLQSCLCGGDHFLVIGLLAEHWHIVDVDQFPIAAHDKYRAAEKASFFDEQTILLAKFGFEYIGYQFYLVHTCCAAPAFLRKGKICADSID